MKTVAPQNKSLPEKKYTKNLAVKKPPVGKNDDMRYLLLIKHPHKS